MWYFGPRNSTSADQRLQTEKPMCSEKIEKIRLRFATREPPLAQNVGSSGAQSSIQRPLRACTPGAGLAGPPRVGERVSTAELIVVFSSHAGCPHLTADARKRASAMFLAGWAGMPGPLQNPHRAP